MNEDAVILVGPAGQVSVERSRAQAYLATGRYKTLADYIASHAPPRVPAKSATPQKAEPEEASP